MTEKCPYKLECPFQEDCIQVQDCEECLHLKGYKETSMQELAEVHLPDGKLVHILLKGEEE